ncbi:MAG TPA: HAD-IA family hydrolase, partial [Micromonospora sp.]
PRRLIGAALAGAGLSEVFQVTLSTEQVPRGKPSPDVYLTVAERLGFDPARCVAVEDSSNGVRAAAAAGMRVLAVPHDRYPLDPDAASAATLILSSIGELTEATVRELS